MKKLNGHGFQSSAISCEKCKISTIYEWTENALTQCEVTRTVKRRDIEEQSLREMADCDILIIKS